MQFRALTLPFALAFVACASGSLVQEDPGPDGGRAACTAMCNGACVDTKTDDKNCGKCGTVCPTGATCTASACQCQNSTLRCGNACVDSKTDTSNCGKCGLVCGNDAGAIKGGGMWTCVG